MTDLPDNEVSTPFGKPASVKAGALPAAANARLREGDVIPRGRIIAWAFWDWGGAAFNAVVTTFVFSTYLANKLFVSPAIVAAAHGDDKNPQLVAALAQNASFISTALAIAGVLIAAIAPVLGQRSDGSGRRKFWLGVNSALVVIAMLGMFFVAPTPSYFVLGAVLLAAGNIFFEIAAVNYNAMLVQVSTPKTLGRVSGFGWGMGYVGGIVLLALLLFVFIGGVLGIPDGGLLGLPSGGDGGSLNIRVAIVVAAAWFAFSAIPLFVRVPEIPRSPQQNRVGIVESYVRLFRSIAQLARTAPRLLLFLIASAVFRDGLAGVFTLGAIIAAQVFGFTFVQITIFGIAANVVAGLGAFLGGWLDDRIGPKTVILGSLVGLVVAGSAVLFVGTAQSGFWAAGLALCLFVGPVQSSSRSFLARITPPGREGEIFGLYATTGRAASFLAPALFALFVGISHDTRLGIVGIVVVLLAGLLLMIPVRGKSAESF